MMMAAEVDAPYRKNAHRNRRRAREAKHAQIKAPRPASLIKDAEGHADEARVCVLNEAPEAKRWRALLPMQQMERRAQIDRRQLRAGMLLRGDWESAGFSPRVTAKWGETPGGGDLVPEERYSRYRWCVVRLPKPEWDIVQAVALLDKSLYAMVGRSAHRRGQVLVELRAALDMLGRLQREWVEEVGE